MSWAWVCGWEWGEQVVEEKGVHNVTYLLTPVTGFPLQQAEKPFAAANYRGRNSFLLQGDKGEDLQLLTNCSVCINFPLYTNETEWLIDFFFSSVLIFFAVSSWKISSCFKPLQFWSNFSLVVDKTTVFPWLCILSCPSPFPSICTYFILLKKKKNQNHSPVPYFLSCFPPFFYKTLTCFAVVSLTPRLRGLLTAPWQEWALTKITLARGVSQATYRILTCSPPLILSRLFFTTLCRVFLN